MEFTKEQTNVAKGVAICLMFAHHLYAFSDRLQNGNSYIPVLPFVHAETSLGNFSNICVSMFLFLSGYGMFLGYMHAKSSPLNYSLGKLKDFYLTYWLYFLVFVPVGIIFFSKVTLPHSDKVRYSTDLTTFTANFLGWDSSYNHEWWFVQMFVATLLCLFPLYARLVEKNLQLLIFISLFLFILSYKVNAYDKLGFIYWQTSFAVGMICAKLKFFSTALIKALDTSNAAWVFAWLLLCFVLRLRIDGTTYDFLFVPFFIYFSVRAVSALQLSGIFTYLGKYSFPLWLTHSFFCYYYFQDFVYAPKWSPLVFLTLLTSSLLSVLGIEKLVSLSNSLVNSLLQRPRDRLKLFR